MLSKKVIKDIQSLSLKKNRDETNLFLAEGPKIVSELVLQSPSSIKAVYALKEWVENLSPSHQHPAIEIVSPEILERISALRTPNQVLAVVEQFPQTKPGVDGWSLYLDTIQDPGNFGTIIRIADWFGIRNLICSRGCADMYNPKTVQSTMGSLARVHIFYDEAEDWLKGQDRFIFAASLHGKPLNEVTIPAKGILLIGNESKGIREYFLDLAKERITIPRFGEAESLNAAVATGIILSHLIR